MYMVSINVANCEGCGECIEPCPVNLLEMVDGKAEISGDAAECMGCETCIELCPNGCFTIQEL